MSKRWLYLLFLVLLSFTACVPDDGNIPDETDPALAFVGNWSVSDNALKLNYEVQITKNPQNSTEILLDNFAGSGDRTVGLVTGKTVTIDNQTLGNGWKVSGSGQYKSSTRLEFQYRLIIGGDEERRTAIFLK